MAEQDAKPKRKFVEAYDYCDESGVMLYQVVRWEPKGFSQRRPSIPGTSPDRDGWTWNLGHERRVLFNLPALIENKKEKRPRYVWIVEGEKDAIALGNLGLLATTNAGGAEKWRDDYSDALAGVPVLILRDYDAPGLAHVEQVIKSLEGKASSIKRIELDGMGAAEDISDWLARGHTKDDLVKLASSNAVELPVADVTAQIVEHAKKILELASKAGGR